MLPYFYEVCGTAVSLVFFAQVTLIKIANTALDKSTALVLSVYDTLYTASALAYGKSN